MVRLNDYRARIKNLLEAPDIEARLVSEGVAGYLARGIGRSRAVIAQGSLGRKDNIVQAEKAKQEERKTDRTED